MKSFSYEKEQTSQAGSARERDVGESRDASGLDPEGDEVIPQRLENLVAGSADFELDENGGKIKSVWPY